VAVRCCGRSWETAQDWNNHKSAEHRCECGASHPMFGCALCGKSMMCNLCKDKHDKEHQVRHLTGGII
jgi:hypothetical protein